jgi:hypothetical protein
MNSESTPLAMFPTLPCVTKENHSGCFGLPTPSPPLLNHLRHFSFKNAFFEISSKNQPFANNIHYFPSFFGSANIDSRGSGHFPTMAAAAAVMSLAVAAGTKWLEEGKQ